MTSHYYLMFPVGHFEWQDDADVCLWECSSVRSEFNMGKSCCAVGCTNRYSKSCGLQFYRFPENQERRRRWIAAVNRKNWEPNQYTWICSSHFINGVKNNDPASPAYVPTIFRHVKSPVKRKTEDAFERYERTKACKKRRQDACQREVEAAAMAKAEAVDGLMRLSEAASLQVEIETGEICTSSVMTEMTMEDLSRLEQDIQQLREDNRHLREAITRQALDEQSLESDNNKVRFFTGLPSFTILMALYNFICPCVKESLAGLPRFQQFLVVLIKLCLNIRNQYLGYQFGVHHSTISRYFKKWMDVMYVRMKPLIKWPEREELLKTMPIEFRKAFKKCIVIIDCFEVFIERPSLKARAQTWSNYKHHNTVKFLIGIEPQGCISFISKGWGGRVSDKHLTENCGILDNMIPGDVILADRGFIVHEAAGVFCAEVKMPPFTKGKK